jgi:hypothetical protein
MDAIKHSTDFVDAKKLLYTERYNVNGVKVNFLQNENGKQTHSAEIEFVKDGTTKTIRSSEADFVRFAWSLKTTLRDGMQKIIEIKDTNRYYNNIEHFIKHTKEDVSKAAEEMKSGRSKLSKDFTIEKAFEDVLSNKYNTQMVKDLIENYPHVLANEVLILSFIQTNFENCKNKSKNPTRFLELFNLAGKVYQENLFSLDPLKAVETYKNVSRIDLDCITKSLLHQNNSTQEKWMGLTKNTAQGVDGQIAAKSMMDDYRDYYELVNKMLRHLAFIASYSELSKFEDSQKGIERTLKAKGYGKLLEPVDRLLRNCGSHWDADYSEKGKIILKNSRGRKPRIIGEISYQKLVDNLNFIRELALLLLLSICMSERILYFRALDSPDLKFRLVEFYKG